MSDTNERLTKVEERLKRVERGNVTAALLDASANKPKVMLVFWIAVTLIGIAIYWYADTQIK